ncbi:hypothetical protein [Saccharopolyspora rosea]|uniref:Uncharacterized protein n=1 Tax=Saccharopolyspora rosea TaxID=524884 RepID=A0ABW3FJF8_9PSEU|nr:hypothetical protein [Saccharopolyspora rosea]
MADDERPDVLTLVAGLIALAVSGYVLLGYAGDLQWLLAVGAAVVGVLMLVVSLLRRSPQDR